jgi:hypothetical protein
VCYRQWLQEEMLPIPFGSLRGAHDDRPYAISSTRREPGSGTRAPVWEERLVSNYMKDVRHGDAPILAPMGVPRSVFWEEQQMRNVTLAGGVWTNRSVPCQTPRELMLPKVSTDAGWYIAPAEPVVEEAPVEEEAEKPKERAASRYSGRGAPARPRPEPEEDLSDLLFKMKPRTWKTYHRFSFLMAGLFFMTLFLSIGVLDLIFDMQFRKDHMPPVR